MVSVAPVSAQVAAKACRGSCARGRQRARGHVAHRGEVSSVGRVVDGECAPVIPVAELSRPTLAAPMMLSKLPDTAPVDVSAPATAPVAALRSQWSPNRPPVQRGQAREGQQVRQQVRY